MIAIQGKSEAEAAGVLEKTRNAILEGGYDELVALATKLAGLIVGQNPLEDARSASSLLKPLISMADILCADRAYLHAAIEAYGIAAHYSLDRDEVINKKAITGILEKAELLHTPAERINAYQLASKESPASGQLYAIAKLKSREQKNPAYFKMKRARLLPVLDEAVVAADLKSVLGEEIRHVFRQQAPSGDIQYSVVVPRGFSRTNLTHAGVQNSQKLMRTTADDQSDRVIIPVTRLSLQTQRDIDFLCRLQRAGIHIDAAHGRIRNAAGEITAYRFPEGANPDRMRYLGVETQGIAPYEGKILVPIGNIDFYADPSLIGKWSWMPDGDGKIRSSVPHSDRPATINSLLAYGITPSNKSAGSEKDGYIVVVGDDKDKLNKVIQQHLLQQRSSHLLSFAEALPGFASTIAVAAYKDACVYVFGLRQSR